MGRDLEGADPPEIVRHILKAQGIAEAVEDEDYASGGAYPALVLSKMLANATLELARAVARLDQDQCDLSDLLHNYMKGTNEDIAKLAQLADEAKQDARHAGNEAASVGDRLDRRLGYHTDGPTRLDQLEARIRKIEENALDVGEDGTAQLVAPKCFGCGSFLPEAEAGDTHTADGCGGGVGLFPVKWLPPYGRDSDRRNREEREGVA